jgi:lipoprotein-releasing system permease protein
MNFEFFIAKRYLWGKKKTSFISTILFISIVGVFLGTMVLIVTLSIMNGFEKAIKTRIVGSFAHVQVLKYHHEPIGNPDSLMAIVRDSREVKAVSPLIEEKIGISSSEVRDGIILRGIDLEKEIEVTDVKKNLKHGGLNLGMVRSVKDRENPGIIVGAYLADKLRIIVGDEVILMSLRGEEDVLVGIMPKMKRATVSGLYESGMHEYDANLAFVSIKTAQQLFDMAGATAIQVKVKDLTEADKAAKKLQDKLGYPYYCVDWMKKYSTLIKWMNSEKFIAFIVISMIIMVALFNIISSLLMVIMEKTGEIGILSSMGAKSSSILRIFVIDGISVGLIGTLAGTIVGLAICFVQIKYNVVKLPGDVYFIDSVPMLVKWLDVVAVVGVANVMCFLFSLYPAFKAARMRPVNALVYK